jgi:hypothetical protein
MADSNFYIYSINLYMFHLILNLEMCLIKIFKNYLYLGHQKEPFFIQMILKLKVLELVRLSKFSSSEEVVNLVNPYLKTFK